MGGRAGGFIVATTVLDAARRSDEELITIYKDQHSVERGLALLKNPLFLASSDFLKTLERIMALSLVMVLCLLVFRLAEHRLRERLAAPGQMIPDKAKKPTNRPPMRRMFQCVEGIELLHIRHGHTQEPERADGNDYRHDGGHLCLVRRVRAGAAADPAGQRHQGAGSISAGTLRERNGDDHAPDQRDHRGEERLRVGPRQQVFAERRFYAAAPILLRT